MSDLIGQRFGPYRLIHLLGQGGFADVYLGQHVHLARQAAIKILHERLIARELENFRQEAQIIVGLHHPNIVRVSEFDIHANGLPFLVMDYLPAGNILNVHPRGQMVSLNKVVSYTRQAALALQHAHNTRIIHRDVKPENFLLGSKKELLLSDFGIAVIAHKSASITTQNAYGTVHYMAPEQIKGHPQPASDQYSLGMVVYEWLCGTRPFSGTFFEVFNHQLFTLPSPLRNQVPTILPVVEEVVLTALAKDPKERFLSVQEFANALEQASDLKPDESGGVMSPLLFPQKPVPLTLSLTPSVAIVPSLQPTQPASHVSPNPSRLLPGRVPTPHTSPTAFHPPQTTNPAQVALMPIVCPTCRRVDRLEKVSALAIKDLSALGQLVSFPELKNPYTAPLKKMKSVLVGCLSALVIALSMTIFIVICFNGILNDLAPAILSGVSSLIGGVFGVILPMRLEQLEAKFVKDTKPQREQAYALWDKLYYCHRDDIVFIPGSLDWRIKPRDMREVIRQEYRIKKI